MKIESTEEGTIYSLRSELVDIKFRIVQRADEEFIIEKKYRERDKRNILWRIKPKYIDVWERVDEAGEKDYVYRLRNFGYISHIHQKFITFNSLESAKKWIKDYFKYPIIIRN